MLQVRFEDFCQVSSSKTPTPASLFALVVTNAHCNQIMLRCKVHKKQSKFNPFLHIANGQDKQMLWKKVSPDKLPTIHENIAYPLSIHEFLYVHIV